MMKLPFHVESLSLKWNDEETETERERFQTKDGKCFLGRILDIETPRATEQMEMYFQTKRLFPNSYQSNRRGAILKTNEINIASLESKKMQ
jgi:hypothetical protein